MGRFIVVVLLGTMFVSVGCAHSGSSSYKKELRTWSRHAEVFNFDSLRAELVWDAVLVTPTMRAARIEREAKLRHLSSVAVRPAISDRWFDDGTIFYISVFAPRDVKGLLSADGYWRLELKDGSGQTYAPIELNEITVTPIERKLFKFVSRWSKIYIARFPDVLRQDLTLTLYGLNATSELRWK